ncbi:MAG: protein nirH [Pseudomonadales bacterium]|uniref:siroheme decarboxylase subunit beta n=1 Tax=unclassified Ketobacter TaxID=2639109 RepID=UPI000C40D6B3|nr:MULTISPECIES: AsnC family transcriptional regulator [unclassified Ketobacter]MAA60100.1 protein nirH [Pseudomonadales bacterium]TNC85662.1 MAG: protein nirH [Alcanivorax sp.]HAU12232.1 protein nirH [Gammaproteobacteria bacterium]MAQ23406.1 protein nirH [Pseudomonadales bacterium]MBI27510.1 protein nirH [Pseudomonadales bacterium]|tara:strand:- start:2737 stop:3249 length:513 start_codon:yes stop_codon:yes gene_type:complete
MSDYVSRSETGYQLCSLDRELIKLTQSGLPLVSRPYHALAEQLGVSADEVKTRFQRMLDHGVIRRIAAVPNHYRLGYGANGMTVWNVPDESVSELGRRIGDLDFVSHCYHRPRHLPDWPYNLFAMVHGHTQESVQDHIQAIAQLIGPANLGSDVLYSTRILKKTGLRLVN